MNTKLLLIVVILNLLPTDKLLSQSESLPVRVYLKDSDGRKVPFAHIYNDSRRSGVISDSSGYFVMNCHDGDSLAIIALGYYSKLYIIDSTNFTNTKKVELEKRYYEIAEVEYTLPRTYEKFKKDFVNLPPEKKVMPELPVHNPYKTPEIYDTNIIYKPGYVFWHPVSGLYYRFSKHAKAERRAWQAKEQSLHQLEIDRKFNRDIVVEITGLTEPYLTQFIGYCNFQYPFLKQNSDIIIREAIALKFKAYLECCYDKHSIDTNNNGD